MYPRQPANAGGSPRVIQGLSIGGGLVGLDSLRHSDRKLRHLAGVMLAGILTIPELIMLVIAVFSALFTEVQFTFPFESV